MRKYICFLVAALLLVFLAACTQEAEAPTVVATFEVNADEGIYETYYEMSDGTWKTDKYTYQYCLVLEDSLSGTGYTAQYTVLSNRDDLTFHQVFLASGISSSTAAYFSEDDAVIVRSVFWENKQ